MADAAPLSWGAGVRSWNFERDGFIAAFALPAVLLVALVTFYPILTAFWVSVHETRFLEVEGYIGLRNYVTLAQNPTVRQAFVNSVVFVLGSMLVTLPLGLGLALILNRPLPLMGLFRAILITPWVVSQPVAAVLWLWMLEPSMGPVSYLADPSGQARVFFLTDPALAMGTVIAANIWLTYPFPMILFLAALKGVPAELYEVAQIDGAGRWAVFRYIVFPFLRPTILSATILLSMLYVDVVALIYLMTGGGPLLATETLAVHVFKQSFLQFNIGVGATVGTFIFIINVVFGAAYVRLLRQRNEALY